MAVFFRQYFLGCLSHASYLIGDETTGRAVVVDPQRDIDAYLADADEAGLTIEKVIETHFHADFLSGHLELAAKTGAEICYGEAADADFPITHLRDGDAVPLGDVALEIRTTPGHTPESISVVVLLELLYRPPPFKAELRLTVQLVSVVVPPDLVPTPPPVREEELPLMVQFVSVVMSP